VQHNLTALTLRELQEQNPGEEDAALEEKWERLLLGALASLAELLALPTEVLAATAGRAACAATVVGSPPDV
jgi:hypothetical protein